MLEAMLLAPILRPMIAGVGTLGDYELDILARDIAAHDANGFVGLVSSRLESAP